MNISVARVMTKAALLEQTVMSGSTAMIFLTLVTVFQACVSIFFLDILWYRRFEEERLNVCECVHLS